MIKVVFLQMGAKEIVRKLKDILSQFGNIFDSGKVNDGRETVFGDGHGGALEEGGVPLFAYGLLAQVNQA